MQTKALNGRKTSLTESGSLRELQPLSQEIAGRETSKSSRS